MNYAYIGEHCDLELAVEKIMWGVFYNSGQSRTSVEGILVHKNLSNKFTNMLTEKVGETLVLQDPMNPECNFGCLNYVEGIQYLDEQIQDAQSQGGQITIGGFQNTDEKGMGTFYEPTIIANVQPGMRMMMEQSFGPLVGIQTVDSPGEAAKIINSQKYALESYVFTSQDETISQLSKSLEVGTVTFNDVPLYYDDVLPVSGRRRNAKMLKSSKHVFKKYARYKSLNIHH